jgi:DNA-binding NarL/FixJ family response regulator
MPFVGRLAVIFVRELTLGLPDGFEDQIRALFGLTPREAAIAACLTSGRTLKQAALDSQIQFTTARSCLEKIFAKTGTHQQSQLVALLKSAQSLAGKAPIR